MTPPKRRGRGEGSVYQRADKKWVAALDLGWANGKRVRKVRYAKTRAGAKAKLGELTREAADHVLVTNAPTVEAWLRYWRDEIAVERIRPSTLKGYNTYIEQHLIPRIGKHRLDKLEPAHVRRLYADMRKPCPDPVLQDEGDGICKHKPSHGLAEATVRQTHAILSRALKVAEREGKVARNVCERVDPPGTGKNPRTPLTVHQARAVLAAAEDDPMVSRWYAALWLGLRQGEALGLSWDDVDFADDCLYISRALQRVKGKGLVFVAPKSDASVRRVPVPPMVMSRLKVHRARGDALNMLDLVWHNDKGGAIAPEADAKAWKRLLEKAGVPHVALHAARNTTGSLLMAAGVPDKVTAEILGHATVQVTQGHYLRGDPEQHQRAMLQLEAYASDDKEITE